MGVCMCVCIKCETGLHVVGGVGYSSLQGLTTSHCGHCFPSQVSQQGDGALLRTLDAILSKHFSQINAKLSSNEAT